MKNRPHSYRLYDLVVDSPTPLSLAGCSDESGDVVGRWRYEEGAVRAPTGRLVHDVADFDGERRLKVWVDDDRGIIFSHGQTLVEWNGAQCRVRLQAGEDMDTRAAIVLERVVAPIALIIERPEFVALHASAVGDGEGNAWVCVGDSGAGKSTTALELMRRGLDILADDLVMIDGSSTELLAATPSVRLFDRPEEVPEAVEDELVMPEIEKFWYRLPQRSRSDPSPSVQAIFSLQPDRNVGETVVERLRGREATVAVVGQAFDLSHADRAWRAGRFRTLCALARQIPVYRVAYGPGERGALAQVEAIREFLGNRGVL